MSTRTDIAITSMGEFVKVGSRHYRHASGLEIRFDAVKSGWRANGYVWPSLRAASQEVSGVAGRSAR